MPAEAISKGQPKDIQYIGSNGESAHLGLLLHEFICYIHSLNVSEAAEYYGIGEKRLRQIAGENEGADFILEVGSHIRFKRKLFEDCLDTASTV